VETARSTNLHLLACSLPQYLRSGHTSSTCYGTQLIMYPFSSTTAISTPIARPTHISAPKWLCQLQYRYFLYKLPESSTSTSSHCPEPASPLQQKSHMTSATSNYPKNAWRASALLIKNLRPGTLIVTYWQMRNRQKNYPSSPKGLFRLIKMGWLTLAVRRNFYSRRLALVHYNDRPDE